MQGISQWLECEASGNTSEELRIISNCFSLIISNNALIGLFLFNRC
jgi:hypothetical protein